MDMRVQLDAPAALSPVPIGLEAGWVSQPVWKLRRKEKFLALAGNRTPASSFSPSLYRLSCPGSYCLEINIKLIFFIKLISRLLGTKKFLQKGSL
jgi:hypothetical protein